MNKCAFCKTDREDADLYNAQVTWWDGRVRVDTNKYCIDKPCHQLHQIRLDEIIEFTRPDSRDIAFWSRGTK